MFKINVKILILLIDRLRLNNLYFLMKIVKEKKKIVYIFDSLVILFPDNRNNYCRLELQ